MIARGGHEVARSLPRDMALALSPQRHGWHAWQEHSPEEDTTREAMAKSTRTCITCEEPDAERSRKKEHVLAL